ncbi:MAG: phosphatase PAP2 family protein [Bacillota bacterium]
MSGIEILRAIQSLHTPLLDQIMGLITDLHHEYVYVAFLPLVYWFYDKRFGRYLFAVFALGFWSNEVLKVIFNTARPDPSQVKVLYPASGPGPAFPSGHSQTPLVFWGALALHIQRRWFTWLAGILVFLIGFSRLYAGLHWPLDVLGGWALGLLVLLGLERSRSFWAGEYQSLAQRLIWAALIPAAGLGVAALVSHRGIAPNVWLVAGVYAGLMTGSTLEEQFVGFDPRRGSPAIQVVKLLVGLALVLAAKEGLKPLLPDADWADMLRYALVALTGTLLAPWLFHRFLARPPIHSRTVRG